MAIAIVPTIQKPDHSKSRCFCPEFKWFAQNCSPLSSFQIVRLPDYRSPSKSGPFETQAFFCSFEIQTRLDFRPPQYVLSTDRSVDVESSDDSDSECDHRGDEETWVRGAGHQPWSGTTIPGIDNFRIGTGNRNGDIQWFGFDQSLLILKKLSNKCNV